MQPALSDKCRTQHLRFYPRCCMELAQLSSVAQCPMPVSTIERNEIHETPFVSCLMTPHNCPKPAQSNIAVGGSALSVLGGKIISHNQSAETSDAEIQWRWLLACVTTNPPISHIGGLTAHHYLSTICKALRLPPSSSPHAKVPFSFVLGVFLPLSLST